MAQKWLRFTLDQPENVFTVQKSIVLIIFKISSLGNIFGLEPFLGRNLDLKLNKPRWSSKMLENDHKKCVFTLQYMYNQSCMFGPT